LYSPYSSKLDFAFFLMKFSTSKSSYLDSTIHRLLFSLDKLENNSLPWLILVFEMETLYFKISTWVVWLDRKKRRVAEFSFVFSCYFCFNERWWYKAISTQRTLSHLNFLRRLDRYRRLLALNLALAEDWKFYISNSDWEQARLTPAITFIAHHKHYKIELIELIDTVYKQIFLLNNSFFTCFGMIVSFLES